MGDINTGNNVDTGKNVDIDDDDNNDNNDMYNNLSPEMAASLMGNFAATTGEVIGSNLKKRLPTIVVGSLTLIAGIAWNNGFKALIDQYIPPEYSSSRNVKIKFFYALLLTIIIIIIISILIKYFTD